ncbi:ATP-binding protein [bacterium]|nr:ATP-binding protein [bacterium]
MKRRLKAWLPRSIYTQSALILLVPVITILLVVTVVFIQRLYEGVTRQMTQGVSHELRLVLERINGADDAAAALEQAFLIAVPLGIEVTSGDGQNTDLRHWLDVSGITVISTLRSEIEGIQAIDLESRDGFAKVTVDTKFGDTIFDISRRRLNARNPHQFLVLIGFTAILMSSIGLIYQRKQMRPIRRLALAAEAFGKGRVVPYRAAGAAEVRLAGGAFLDMRDRIERQIEQRTMMLSGVSHDLRTPLTRMKLSLSLMVESEDTEAMARDVEDMEQMLEAFLAFARGDAQEDPERTDPLELARDVVNRASRNGPVQLGPIEGDGTAMLRPAALRRALDNLITNAVRYGNQARVSAKVKSDLIEFIVEDSGPGIDSEKHDYVLKPFVRLDEARNQNSGSGVGLGLTIAADIARQHGGMLKLGQSRDLGGLQAIIAIPR